MNEKCPKCEYIRQSTDYAPEGQCPKCQIIYSKYNNDNSNPPLINREEVQNNKPASLSANYIIKIAVAILVVAIIIIFTSKKDNSSVNLSDLMPDPETKIIMFSANYCGYCKLAKQLFEKYKVKYIEYDVQSSEAIYKNFKALQGSGVPLIFINNTRIEGYSEQSIIQVLKNEKLI
ncbi:MAG: glutaredoxin [Desulfobacterales bacterium]|nr:glutaredoxin [Desulfobacterales bacterium]